MDEGNIMAEMRRIKLERQRRNLTNPPSTNLTRTPAQRVAKAEEIDQPAAVEIKPKDSKRTMDGGKCDSNAADLDKNKKSNKSDSPQKPTNSEPPQKQQCMDGVCSSSTVVIPQGTSFSFLLCGMNTSSFREVRFEEPMNHLLYSAKDNSFLKEQIPLGITRLITRRALQIASIARHME
ncbi:30S ribosomal protein S16 [Sesbania bispinosa]|nr:30S ribosomal protein S16 [Sesbania bispinosa]